MKYFINLLLITAITISCNSKDEKDISDNSDSPESPNISEVESGTSSNNLDAPIYKSVDFDSLINSLDQNEDEVFKINEQVPNDVSNLTLINSDIYYQIYGNISDFDDAAKEYFLSKVRTTDSYLQFLTYSITGQGENHNGSPYYVHSIDLYFTKVNGELINCITLATQDNAVFTYEIDSQLSNDKLIVHHKYWEEGDSEYDTLWSKSLNYSIAQTTPIIDTVSVESTFELIEK